jgi:hypothetical protein
MTITYAESGHASAPRWRFPHLIADDWNEADELVRTVAGLVNESARSPLAATLRSDQSTARLRRRGDGC